jgi:hypothetical protein
MTFPDPTSRPDTQAPWKRRAAAAEINGRRVNEAIERGTDGPRPVFVCECGNIGCQAKVTLSIAAYESVRQDFDRFLVVPGHEIANVDRVIEEHPGFLVVVKVEPEAKAMAEESDQRSE